MARLATAGRLLWLVVMLGATVSLAQPTTAGPDYLAPIPAGSAEPCQDTAPDCMDVCGCDETGIEFACRLSSPIGEYLRYPKQFLHSHAILSTAIGPDRPCLTTGPTARRPVASAALWLLHHLSLFSCQHHMVLPVLVMPALMWLHHSVRTVACSRYAMNFKKIHT